MKKICSMIVTAILVATPFLQVSAYDIIDEKKIAVKSILVTKSQLKKISNGEQYIQAMDTFVNKIKDNQKKLDSIEDKLSTVINKIESKKWDGIALSKKENDLLKILTYLQARVKFTQLDNLQKIEEAKENKLLDILDAAKNPNISESDKEKLENAVIKIQKNLLNQSKLSIDNIMGDFEDYFNYENKGDFEMNFNTEHESIGNIKAEFKLSDYVTQTSNFDSRFNGHISAMIDALPKGEDAVKGEFNSFVDFILKDGKYYGLIKDLNIVTEENLEDFQDILDNLKNLAKENNYIELSDDKSIEAMELIKSFHPDNFYNDADKLFSESMFTAYKKDGEIYSIIPTKYACDSMKVLMNKFDPFSPDTCTESQYNELVEDIISQGELTMTLGNENILKYSAFADDYMEQVEMSVAFTDTSVKRVNIDIIPNQIDNKGEGATLAYEKNKSLYFKIYADKGEFDVIFDSKLDSRNNISSLKHSGYVKGWNDVQDWKLDINNRKITGNYSNKITRSSYDYETGEYVDGNTSTFEANITGKNNSRNELNNFDITYKGNDGEMDYLNGEIIYNLPQLKIVNNYQDNYGNAEFMFDGKWNTVNKNFDNFEISANVENKESTYNYDTYSYEYSDEMTKVFDMDYSLQNTKVEGKLNIYNNEEVVFGVISNGTYKKDLLQLNNEISTDAINIFVGQLEGARDMTRISDIYTLRTAIEQSYQDNAEYPNQTNFNEMVSLYLSYIPNDPSGNIEINGCKFGYIYEVGSDQYGIENQAYKISTCLESERNIYKIENDDGNDSLRYENGTNINQTMKERFYINNYTTWEKQDKSNSDKPVLNINFGYDSTSNNSNQNLYIDSIYEGEKVFEFNMKNTGTIEYKKIDIQAPENSTPFDEVFETNNNYYY